MGFVGKTVTQNVVSGSEITDGTVTGADLASDIAISTSGAITTTGAFTSVGIDDNGDATTMTIDTSENVGIGNTSPSSQYMTRLVVGDGSGTEGITIYSGNDSAGRLEFSDATSGDGRYAGGIMYEHDNNALRLNTNGGNERLRIDSSGNIIVGGTTDNVIYDDSSGNAGPILHSRNAIDVARNDSCITLNSTTGSAATFMDLRRVGSTIGTIAHDGSGTVSFNAFTGCHWGRLSDNSKPTILKGTILETIDEMCDWYEVEFTIPEVKYVDGDNIPEDKKIGDVKTKTKDKKHLVPLADIGSKKVGDSFTFTYKDGVKYTGTLKLQDDEKHSKCKISDTADSKKVYGVFFSWDGVDDGYNDMYIAGLGTYVVRVYKDVTVESGDLLVSNGDGTAKVQDDDIIRSKTVAKVLANIKQETYSDGSYTVPCALYCG